MPDFSILLPPSEGKRTGGNPFAPDMFDYRSSNTFNYFSTLNPERRKLIKVLQRTIRKEETDLSALFGLKDDNLQNAIDINLQVLESPLMAALDRYSPGVMYQAMDFAGLPTGAQRRLLENAIIFSGLFGLLRPDDLIPNYRLKMDASLPGLGKVSKFWRPHINETLNPVLEGRFVWNLLPGAHQDAWTDEHTYRQMVRIRFFKEQNGERKPITHQVKSLRGMLVNFIVRESANDWEALREWQHPEGYTLDEDASRWDEEKRTAELIMVTSG